jgi:hypothetical protein
VQDWRCCRAEPFKLVKVFSLLEFERIVKAAQETNPS